MTEITIGIFIVGIFIFILQLLLCYKSNNKIVKLIPLFLIILGVVYTAIIYVSDIRTYNPNDIIIMNQLKGIYYSIGIIVSALLDGIAWCIFRLNLHE